MPAIHPVSRQATPQGHGHRGNQAVPGAAGEDGEGRPARPGRRARALAFLYERVLRRQLGELPLARPPRLLDQVKQVMRVKHYALRTEQCYTQWIRRFILFHGRRHPRDMGAAELELFLTDLAVRGRVSVSTQNQALNAIVFLYRDVLDLELGRLDAVRAGGRGACQPCWRRKRSGKCWPWWKGRRGPLP